MFIYILNLFMQMSQYLNARFQEMTFSLTWNTGHILTSSNMRCKKDSKENIMQISKLDITNLKFHIKDWEVSPYQSKHLCMAIFWNNTQQIYFYNNKTVMITQPSLNVKKFSFLC